MAFTTIILDFDGVILESVSVKTEAFRRLFAFVLNHVEIIVQSHLVNRHMSWFDKFGYISKNILKVNLWQQKFEVLSEKFASIIFKDVSNAHFVLGPPIYQVILYD